MSAAKPVQIGILVYPGCLPSSAVGPADVFRIANTLAQIRPARRRVVFNVEWLSVRRKNFAVGGISFNHRPLREASPDVLLLPSAYHDATQDLAAVLQDTRDEQLALQNLGGRLQLLGSACSGTCLVAEAGLLDGHRATTSWWLGAFFRNRYPLVALDAEQLVVRDRSFLSSGGITSYFDLALWLVGHFGGEELRQLTARILVIDAQRASQAPYIASAMIQSEGHVLIERARRWLNERLDKPCALPELAAHCHTSQRTLARRFQQVLGCTPVAYLQQLRVERARALLESTQLSLQDITGRCGYEDVSTFSKVFKRRTQLTPREYRSRYCVRV
ncbi:MAG: helix-turn-helix domain-containing protein [Burkholderiales bacterium]|nr:helix-turn-helix domain-containing protein [Burkholderiales bacterium]